MLEVRGGGGAGAGQGAGGRAFRGQVSSPDPRMLEVRGGRRRGGGRGGRFRSAAHHPVCYCHLPTGSGGLPTTLFATATCSCATHLHSRTVLLEFWQPAYPPRLHATAAPTCMLLPPAPATTRRSCLSSGSLPTMAAGRCWALRGPSGPAGMGTSAYWWVHRPGRPRPVCVYVCVWGGGGSRCSLPFHAQNPFTTLTLNPKPWFGVLPSTKACSPSQAPLVEKLMTARDGSISQSINQSCNQPTNQSTNQSCNQPNKQTNKQSCNQPYTGEGEHCQCHHIFISSLSCVQMLNRTMLLMLYFG